jgi:NTE family protein
MSETSPYRFPPDNRSGVVLGGGGARGLAGIGILEVLVEAGLRPAAVAGTSMGAMIGAFWAAGHSVSEMRRLATSLKWTDVFDISVAGGIMRGGRFQQWLASHLPPRFEDLRFPLVCTATDIDTGELVYLREGDLPSAIRATCAFPGAFVPVERDGRNLVDGGLKSTVPVRVIREYDVDRVVACDFQPPPDRAVVPGDSSNWRNWSRFWETLTFRRRNLAADILLKAVDILQTEVSRRQLADHPPDLLIAPPMNDVNIEDFRLTPQIIAAGAEEARRVLAVLESPDAPRADPGG